MTDTRAFPTSILVEESQILFNVTSAIAGAALFGQGDALTVAEAAELIEDYTGNTVTPTGIEIAMRAGPFTFGDGASSSYTIPHFLGNPAPQVIVWDKSQSPAAVIQVETQAGSDDDHVVISSGYWESNPPASNTLEALVIG